MFKQLEETLRAELSAVKEAIGKLEYACRDSIAAAIRPTQSEITDAQVRYDQQERAIKVQRRLVIATWCAFVAAFAYAGIAACQLSTMRSQTVELRNQVRKSEQSIQQAKDLFLRDTRPYLAETSKSTSAPQIFANPLTPGKVQIVWSWSMTNYGKSPADEIVMHQEMSLLGGAFQGSYGGDGKRGGKSYDVGSGQPQGGDSFDTILSPPMEEARAKEILASKAGVSIRVHITYTSLDGKSYESALCLIYKSQGAISYCKEDNYIH